MKALGIRFDDYGINGPEFVVLVNDDAAEETVKRLKEAAKASGAYVVEEIETTTVEEAIARLEEFAKDDAEEDGQ